MSSRWSRCSKRIPFVAQMTASECPVACLAMVLAHHGRPVPLRRLRAALGTGRDGANAHALVQAAAGFGLVGRGLRLDPAHLHTLAPGTILHWDAKHFVVLERATKKRLWILDPAIGRRRLGLPEVERSFSGLALAFHVDPGFTVAANAAAPEASPVWRSIARAALRPGFLAPTLIASLCSTALGIAGAMVMAELVARLSAPQPRFADLAVGIVAIVAATVAVRAWREWQLHRFGAAVELELGHGLVQRLLRLPLAFFRHRTAADLTGRVASVHGLNQRLVIGVGTLVTEAPMALGYLAVLCWWNATMAVSAVVIVTAHAAASLGLRRHQEQRARAVLRHEAQTKAFEAQWLAQITVMKAMGCEAAVAERWSQLRADAAQAADLHGRANASGQSGLEGFAALIPLTLLAVGAHEVAIGALTLPAMIGTNCLAVALFRPVASLVAAVESFVAMRRTIGRIDDIMLEPEPVVPGAGTAVAFELPAAIALYDVTVVGDGGEPTLDAISLATGPVRHLAIIGGAASGKSALAAVIAGVSRPAAGRVQIGGHDLAALALGPGRDHRLCLVPPSAPLLDGNLRDNVSLGATDASDEAIARACRIAGVHDEIGSLPLRYATAVYDGGRALPVGLRQRIVIARALARQPRLLVIDEAAASLGAAAEGRLVEAVLAGPVRTLITVTHHRSTIERADRVVVLDHGRLVDMGSPAALRARCLRYRELTEPTVALLPQATGT
jgi:ATP-binding cassette, subfamily B, bacterial